EQVVERQCQRIANRVHRLVVKRRELRRQLGLGRGDLRRIEQLVRVAGRLPQYAGERRGKMELGDFRSDGTWQSLREDAPEDGRADGAADVAPELNLAGTDAEVALWQGTLHGIDVERHGDPEAETDHDDVDRDRHLGARR